MWHFRWDPGLGLPGKEPVAEPRAPPTLTGRCSVRCGWVRQAGERPLKVLARVTSQQSAWVSSLRLWPQPRLAPCAHQLQAWAWPTSGAPVPQPLSRLGSHRLLRRPGRTAPGSPSPPPPPWPGPLCHPFRLHPWSAVSSHCCGLSQLAASQTCSLSPAAQAEPGKGPATLGLTPPALTLRTNIRGERCSGNVC